jgi:hypothetical protein
MASKVIVAATARVKSRDGMCVSAPTEAVAVYSYFLSAFSCFYKEVIMIQKELVQIYNFAKLYFPNSKKEKGFIITTFNCSFYVIF